MNTAEKMPERYGMKASAANESPVKEVVCQCGHRICDSEGVIRSRCVKIVEGVALCRCKVWVEVPVGSVS